MRNIPIWLIVSFPLTIRGFDLLGKEAAKFLLGEKRLGIAYKWLAILSIVLCTPQIGGFLYGVFGHGPIKTSYPVEAVAYLKSNLPAENIFTSYDFGGFFILQFPERKVFVDGRMPSWRWNANIPGESNYAFKDYKDVLSESIPFSTFAQKFHINTLMVSATDMTAPSRKIFGIKVENNSYLQKLFFSEFSFYGVVQQAKKMGWQIVYHDSKVVIIEKPGVGS
jgi:hypothetical protein